MRPLPLWAIVSVYVMFAGVVVFLYLLDRPNPWPWVPSWLW